MSRLYLLHPAAIHFPLALLITGLGMCGVKTFRKNSTWLTNAVSCLLWLGTASLWISVGLGLLAKRLAPHVPSAWEDLATHETLAYWTSGAFAGLSLWRYFLPERWPRIFLTAWLAAVSILSATAYYGGKLVFDHNMGTTASTD